MGECIDISSTSIEAFKMREFDILSFDGGGSKGVMEMVLLQDVMNTVTLLTQNPDKLFKMIGQKDDLFTTATERCELAWPFWTIVIIEFFVIIVWPLVFFV